MLLSPFFPLPLPLCPLASCAARLQNARMVAASLPPANSCNKALVAVILPNSAATLLPAFDDDDDEDFFDLLLGKCLANSSFAPLPSKN